MNDSTNVPVQLSEAELRAVVEAWIRRDGARPGRRPDNPILPLLQNVMDGGDFTDLTRLLHESERQLRHAVLNIQAALATLDPDAFRIVYALLVRAEQTSDELLGAFAAAAAILDGSSKAPVLN